MLLPQEAHARANQIRHQLQVSGYPLVMVKYLDDGPFEGQISAQFTLCAASPSWRKNIVLDAGEASAAQFLAIYDKWRSTCRSNWAIGEPSVILRGAIASHGEETIRKVLYA